MSSMVTAAEINEDKLWNLSGVLGYHRHVPLTPYVNCITMRKNTKVGGKYIVGGSTYVCSTIGVSKRVDDMWHQTFSTAFTETDPKAHFVVFGYLHSRSPLLKWDLQCKFVGFIGSNEILSRNSDLIKDSDRTLQLAGIDRDSKFSLLKKDESAFVFEIKYVRCAPKKESWCDPAVTGGSNYGKHIGYNLRRLGLSKSAISNFKYMNSRDLQTMRFAVAEYGVPDSFGFTKLNLLTNEKLKAILRTKRLDEKKQMRTFDFPSYSFYGHRILEAARAHSKSDEWWKTVVHFLPSYGQYLRDDKLLLSRLQNVLPDVLNNDSCSVPVDYIFYGGFNDCWKSPPRWDQIWDTLVYWEKYRLDFVRFFTGWRARYEQCRKLWENRSWFGNTAYTETTLKKLIGKSPLVLDMLHFKTLDFDDHYCFEKDWLLYEYFATNTLKNNVTFVRGIGKISDLDPSLLLIFPSYAVQRYYGSICSLEGVNFCVFRPPYQYYLHTFHIVDDKLSLKILFSKYKGSVALVGMEYWPVDVVCYLQSVLKSAKMYLHYFGFTGISSTSKSSYRCSPTLNAFEMLENFKCHELMLIDNDIDEEEPETDAELNTYVSDHMKGMTIDRHSFENGYQVVYFYNEDMKGVHEVFSRLYFRPDLKDDSDLDTHFYLGDRVITSCGFIDYIAGIRYKGVSVSSIHKETYTGCEIRLGSFHKRLHATELRLAYVLTHSDILLPLPNVIMYGKFPDYVLKQYENYLCSRVLVKHPSYSSKDQELNREYNRDWALPLNRCNPLSGVLLDLKERKDKEEKERALVNSTKRRLEKIEKMKAYVRKRFKDQNGTKKCVERRGEEESVVRDGSGSSSVGKTGYDSGIEK